MDIDYTLCIICQTRSSKPIIKNLSNTTLCKVISLSKERDKCGDTSVKEFVNRVTNITVEDIIENSGFYHKHCYRDFGNKQ